MPKVVQPAAAKPLTREELKYYLKRLHLIPLDEQKKLLDLLREEERRAKVGVCQTDFLAYVKHVWPGFIAGKHHTVMAEAFERIAAGKLDRLIMALPPRHTKSEFGSVHLPSWYLGKYPDHQIIQCSNTLDLSQGFGRKVRDLVNKDVFAEIFPNVSLKEDSRAAGRWSTNHGGQYYAIGVGGTITGRGGNLIIIDDPFSEQDAISGKPKLWDSVYDWYMAGPRQRVQPRAAIVVIATRWNKMDLTGRLLEDQKKRGGDKWEYIELPAILPDGSALWPEYWPLEELLRTKASLSSVPHRWAAQYQQQPTAAESAIVPANLWRRWQRREPPKCDYIIQSWDTAYQKSQRSDYSACTTWGMFQWSNDDGIPRSGIILLSAKKGKWEFAELKNVAREEYKYWNPDSLIIEMKASGLSLIQELRRSGIPVMPFDPVRSGDKVLRLNTVSDMFQSGLVWAPEGEAFAEDVIEEIADFPNGQHDDFVDSSTQALIRLRQGGLVRMPAEDEDDKPMPRLRGDYY